MRVGIRGIIGAGKSTFVEGAMGLGWDGSFEPVATNPYLVKFYAGDDSVILPMELSLALERQRQFIKMADNPKDTIADRTAEEDPIFASILHESGRMSAEDYEMYKNVFHRLFEDVPPLDVVVWLKVSPETALKRIRSRGRESEQQVSDEDWLAYLYRLEAAYNASDTGSNVLVVDWETPVPVSEIMERVIAFSQSE